MGVPLLQGASLFVIVNGLVALTISLCLCPKSLITPALGKKFSQAALW